MDKKLIIAIDAMGGDQAPDMTIAGASIARVRHPDVKFIFYGDEARITPLLMSDQALAENSEVVHTDDIVRSEDKPSQALRRGRKSSMGLAIQAVKDGTADVAVSAGNTGALMALAKFMLRTMPGINRPALISLFPTLRGESVMLDLGANVECDAQNLVEFAIMGSAYVSTVLGLSKPTVGLLNVGVEELKGRDTIREAAEILKLSSHLPLEYRGFVEGDSLGAGDVDVVVTDGFTGNVALKTAEGTAKLMSKLLARALTSSTSSKLGYLLARKGLRSLKDHMDPNNHNGGVFLGLNGLVVKSHGGANAEGYATAVATAYDMARNNLNKQIEENLHAIHDIEDNSGPSD